MGEDPIIVKPGKYPGLKETDADREGICLVIDAADLWDIKVEGENIVVTMPWDGKFIVVPDETTGKRKVAILRVNGDFTGMNLNGTRIPSYAKSEIAIFYSDRSENPGGGA